MTRSKLLTLHEVAETLGLSIHTVRRWASERRLPVVKLGRAVRVSGDALDRLVQARCVEARRDLAL